MRRVRLKYRRTIQFTSRIVTIPNERVFFRYNKIRFAQYTQLSLKQCERGHFTSKKKWNKRSQQYLYVKYAYVVNDTHWMYVFTSNRPTRSPQCRQKRKPNNNGSNCKKYDHINLTFHFWLATFCNSETQAVGKSAIQRVNNMNKKKRKSEIQCLGRAKVDVRRVYVREKKKLYQSYWHKFE